MARREEPAPDPQSAGSESPRGLEVVLAQGEQGQAALEDVVVDDVHSLDRHGVLRVDHRRQVDALKQTRNQGEATMTATNRRTTS
jgi:hypothetical protein